MTEPVNPWSKPDRSLAAILDVLARPFVYIIDRLTGGAMTGDDPDARPDPEYRWWPALILLLALGNLAYLSADAQPFIFSNPAAPSHGLHPAGMLPVVSFDVHFYVQLGLLLWLSGLGVRFMRAFGPSYAWDERQQALAGSARNKGLIGTLLLTITGLAVVAWQLGQAAQLRVEAVLPHLLSEMAVLLMTMVIVYRCTYLLSLAWAERSVFDPE
jgi:hypothetical protein